MSKEAAGIQAVEEGAEEEKEDIQSNENIIHKVSTEREQPNEIIKEGLVLGEDDKTAKEETEVNKEIDRKEATESDDIREGLNSPVTNYFVLSLVGNRERKD